MWVSQSGFGNEGRVRGRDRDVRAEVGFRRIGVTMARASRESLRTGVTAVKGGAMAIWENSGARMPRTAARVKTTHIGDDLALLRCRPAKNESAASLVPFESEARPQSRDLRPARGWVDEDRASSSGASEGESHERTFHRGMHRRRARDSLGARQCVYTLHPSSRTSIRPTSINTVPHVRILGTPKDVFCYKKGICQLLLDGPNSPLLPRSSIRVGYFSTRPESSQKAPGPVREYSRTETPGKSRENDGQVGLHYMRHGKEFLVGVRGSREDVENIKARIAHFLRTELHLEVGLPSHVHIQAGTVMFLGTRIAGLLDNKARRRFSKETEKRRRTKARAQGEAHIRTETWHNELKDFAVQSWAFGLKKTKRELQSWEPAKQDAMYKKLQDLDRGKFVLEQIDRGVTKDVIQRLLDKEEEVFIDGRRSGLPEPILRAHERLTRLLKKHLEKEAAFEKKAKALEGSQAKNIPSKDEYVKPGDDDSIPIQVLAPMEIITEKLSVKGILQPSKALPTVLTPMLDCSDEAIVSYFAALGACLLSYYRCCDNFEKIRRLVDHQVRWSALFTLGSKHGCSARQIIRQFSRGPKIVDRNGSAVVEFPSSPDIARTGKKFLVHVQHNPLDDVLRSRPLQLRRGASEDNSKGPRRAVRQVREV